MNQFDLHLGNCLDVLQTLPDASIDAIVTDPPYGLSFMGKRWDYDVPSVEIWQECLRVLKPGGHLLAFAGTRTQHRMAVRIEDAGFEIRDLIAWVYGSGFPKSHDVSKAIDKAGGDAFAWRAFSSAYAAAVAASGLTHSDIDRALGIKSSSCYWARMDSRGGMPPRHHWEKVCDLLSLPDHFVSLYDEAEREVVGQKKSGISNPNDADRRTVGGSAAVVVDITAPATDAARAWQGWGTALKPALEPITVARKPLDGTVAQNVLTHGPGALNIDACRIDAPDGVPQFVKPNPRAGTSFDVGSNRTGEISTAGRWPANLIHDGSDEVVGLFPQANHKTGGRFEKSGEGWGTGDHAPAGYSDSGSAARFFYCAKASRRDREEGLEAFEARRPAAAEFRPNHAEKAEAGEDGNPYGRWGEIRNTHPTVKPTDLMRYLCRLVTPPGGVVLDPFMGSGSTGKAAMREGFRFVGIEREPEYLEIARARIAAAWAPIADLGTPPAVNDNAPAQMDLFARGIE